MILHRDVFWFFLKDEVFVSKTINDSNTDLDKFPGSKVRQLAKKMENSKATARHIWQVASDLQVAYVTPGHRSPSKQTQEEKVLCET